jgi:hypothetical protein
MKSKLPALCAAHPETPVEPVAAGIAQFLVEEHVIAPDLIEGDVAAGEFVVDSNRRALGRSPARRRE